MTKTIGTIISFALILLAISLQYTAEEIVEQSTILKEKQSALQQEVDKYDIAFMKRALQLSAMSFNEDHDHAFGSVVVLGSRVVGQGRNRVTTLKDASAHAEVEAIRDACRTLSSASLEGCSIYASGKPCPMCLSLIYLSGIEKIFYQNNTDVSERYGAFSAADVYNVLQVSPLDRPIPEIPVDNKVDTLQQTTRPYPYRAR